MINDSNDFRDIDESTVVGALIIVFVLACVAVLGVVVTLMYIL
jgi:hypothetical protein